MKLSRKITSVKKGSYGQWIVTAEISGYFYSKQYYGYTKKASIELAKQDIKEDTFGLI